MEQSTLAIIILVVTLICYGIPKIPLSVTTILAVLAMAGTGIIKYNQAFSGFSNSVIFLVAGLMVIGKATVTTGLAQRIGGLLGRGRLGKNETLFMMSLFVLSAFVSAFVNASLTVAILMPVIDAVVLQSDGVITRKDNYMVLGISSVLGNNILTIGATSMLTAVSLLDASGYGHMGILVPAAVNLPAVIVVALIFLFFGKKLQHSWFDFPDVPVAASGKEKEDLSTKPVWKQWFVAIDLIVVVIALIANVNYALAALLGASVLVLSGCLSEKEAYGSVSWGTIVIVAGAIGFSSAIQASGAGKVIADFFVTASGPLGTTGFGLCIVLFFVSTLLSNVMSDNATVAIMLPIAMAIAASTGFNPIPLFLATCSGTKVGLATPICVAPMTQIGVAGYRFKDYLRLGGLVNIVCMVVTCICINFIYF